MESDYDMRRILTPLLSELLKFVGVTTITPDLFVPYGHLTADFYQNFKTALLAKKPQVLRRWQNFFENSCLNALLTHDIYLRYVMFACNIEVKLSNNIFDELLNVFILVINFNTETLINSWVNFCDLSVDIFMVFYKRTLRVRFYMQGGFQQFAEYLRNNSNFSGKKYELSEHKMFPYNLNFIKHNDVIGCTLCESLAIEVLCTKNLQLPVLANPVVVAGRLQAARQQKTKASAAALSNGKTCPIPSKHETSGLISTGETSERGSKRKVEETDWKQTDIEVSPVPEKTAKHSEIPVEDLGKHKTHVEWIQHIAQTFNEYHNSKCTDPTHAKSRFHLEADKFLKQLEDMIRSLANVLQYYEE